MPDESFFICRWTTCHYLYIYFLDLVPLDELVLLKWCAKSPVILEFPSVLELSFILVDVILSDERDEAEVSWTMLGRLFLRFPVYRSCRIRQSHPRCGRSPASFSVGLWNVNDQCFNHFNTKLRRSEWVWCWILCNLSSEESCPVLFFYHILPLSAVSWFILSKFVLVKPDSPKKAFIC